MTTTIEKNPAGLKTKAEQTKNGASKNTMKGLVYGGPGKIELKDIPKPVIEKPTDALVKIIKTTICGTDLGILHGKTPTCKPGTTLGHEGVGIIEEVGVSVRNFKIGDHVIISCITSDGTCEYCKKQMYSHCEDGGWILGHLINGTQAEYVRIPHADNSLHAIPSCPSVVPGLQVGALPCKIPKSVPQIVVLIILTNASVGFSITGLGMSFNSIFPGPP